MFIQRAHKQKLYFKMDQLKSGSYIVPNLLFHQKGDSLYVYAFKEFKNDKTVLFHAPFPNLSSDGNMCFGNIESLSRCKCTTFKAHLDHLKKVFWDTYFTHDSGQLVRGVNYIQLMKSLVDTETPFPEEYLLQSKVKLHINEQV